MKRRRRRRRRGWRRNHFYDFFPAGESRTYWYWPNENNAAQPFVAMKIY